MPKPINSYRVIYLKLFFFLIIFISTHNLFGQIIFEKGYFINNDGIKVNCLIKNYEWKNSPDKIEYKLTSESPPLELTLSDIQEFMVSNFKFKKFNVKIDQSNTGLSNLNDTQKPVFENHTVFLRFIIEGEVSLLEYSKNTKYFIQIKNTAAQQLIFKEYISNSRVMKNNTYQSQLYEILKDTCITLDDIKETRYTKKSLINYFEKYYRCNNIGYVNYDNTVKKDFFFLSIRPGIRFGRLAMKSEKNSTENVVYDTKANPILGIEAEFFLPFNKNSWSFVIDPAFQIYKSNDPRPNYSNEVNYKSIEIPVGFRYYLFLSSKSKMFFGLSYVIFDIPFNSNIGYREIKTSTNFNIGLGYNYNNRFTIELKYATKRSLLTNYVYTSADYQSISLNVGYRFFKL